jgi:hypothetical protein
MAVAAIEEPVPVAPAGPTPAARAASIATRLNLAHADLVELCVEVLADGSWVEAGIRSPVHWLVLRAALSPTRAREVVAVARRRAELPALHERLEAGRVSIDQAAVLAKHAPATHQRSAAELADVATVPQLQRTLSRYVFDPGGPDAPSDDQSDSHALDRAQAPATLTMGHDEKGRFHLHLDAPSDQGALVQNALREAKDALFDRTGTRGAATLGEAMVEIASRSLASVGSVTRASHYRVYVHLDADSPSGWVNGGGAIPPGLAARFACDGVVQPLIERDGRPVSVGRDRRIVPAATRRLIHDRDRGCVHPACTARGFVEIHHLRPWAQGGSTDYETNVSLCPYHHRAVHAGDVLVSGDPTRPLGEQGGLRFTNRYGIALRPPVTHAAPGQGRGEANGGSPDPAPPWWPPPGEPMIDRWVSLPPDDDPADREHRRARLRLVEESADPP